MWDILLIVISLSNMIMLYGVSDSIKKSVDKQVREDRIVSTLDELISEEYSSSENNSNEDKSLHEYLGTSKKSNKHRQRKSRIPYDKHSDSASTDPLSGFNTNGKVINASHDMTAAL